MNVVSVSPLFLRCCWAVSLLILSCFHRDWAVMYVFPHWQCNNLICYHRLLLWQLSSCIIHLCCAFFFSTTKLFPSGQTHLWLPGILSMVDSRMTPVTIPPSTPPLSFSLLVTLFPTMHHGSLIVIVSSSLFLSSFISIATTSTNSASTFLMYLLPTTVNIRSYFSFFMVHNTYRTWKSQFLDMLTIHNLKHFIAVDAQPLSPLLNGIPNSFHFYYLCVD